MIGYINNDLKQTISILVREKNKSRPRIKKDCADYTDFNYRLPITDYQLPITEKYAVQKGDKQTKELSNIFLF